ncbi:MAG: hypothetical protein H6799_00650 [Candidatus Nomurabacteria bacterium]|nr:MAG: hypothetical protein H6799_00650 [Candidatus Nomurabacteria bacterium]HRV75899.1 hypothetical protein [Candidatus Saccharimonadales bacterium]
MTKSRILLVPFLVLLLSLVSDPSVFAESTPDLNIFISEEVGAWGTTPAQKRTGQQEAFNQSDTLDDEWISSLNKLKEPDTELKVSTSQISPDSPNVYTFLNLNNEQVAVTADNVDIRNLSTQNDLGVRSSDSYQYKAKLDLPGSGANTYNGNTMQDFAPIPNQFAGQYYANESQNGFGDQNNYRNGLLFTFSEPLQAFGVWLGDLETRTDGNGTPALLRIFNPNDELILERTIPPNNWITNGDLDQSICGTANTTTDLINKMGCGHNTTRFIGFSSGSDSILSLVKRMLIIVGDDDNFPDQPENNNGNTEHISFIGPTVAFFQAKTIITDPADPHDLETPIASSLLSAGPVSTANASSSQDPRIEALQNYPLSLAKTGQPQTLSLLFSLSLVMISGYLTTKQSHLYRDI